MTARYTGVKRYQRGVPSPKPDVKYRSCLRCKKTATVTALNRSYLIIPVHYCEDHAIEGGVIDASS